MNIWIVLYKAPPVYFSPGGDLSGNYIGYNITSGTSIASSNAAPTPVMTTKYIESEIIGAFHKEDLAEKFMVQRISDCRFSLGNELAVTIVALYKDPGNNKIILDLYNKYSGGNLSAKKVKLQGHPLE